MNQYEQLIRYSRGASKFDNKPEQRTCQSFDEFERAVLSDRAPRKGMNYICAPLALGKHGQDPERFSGDDHWRLKDQVLARSFIPFDCDWFASPEHFHSLIEYAARFRGFGYTTASHNDNAPRARLIFAASRPMSRDDCILVCKTLQSRILDALGLDSIKFDETVYRGEQPVYTPVETSQAYHFGGISIDVDTLIAGKKLEHTQKAAPHRPSLLEALYTDTGFEVPDMVSDGEGRESTILRYASSLRSQGLSEVAIKQICLDYNQLHVTPPLDEAVVLDRVSRSPTKHDRSNGCRVHLHTTGQH